MNETSANLSASTGPANGAPPVIGTVPNGVKRWWVWVALALLAGVVAGLLFFFNPAQNSFYPFCVFYRVTGWQCPGCGGLRAAHQLLHGHVDTAFRFNQLVVLVLPVVLILGARRLLRGPGEPRSHRAMARWAWVAFTVLVLFWIARNLPLAFFQMPTS